MRCGAHPVRVFQGIAAGVLGRESFNGGLPAALAGAGLHAFIASVGVVVYRLASRKLPALARAGRCSTARSTASPYGP